MIPILYEGTETSFTKNGIGRLSDAISCNVVEERNGLYELEMQYPVDGIFYDEITEGRIILALPFDGGTTQPFTIYQITKPLNQIVTVRAQHISYMLSGIVVMPFTASSCAQAIANVDTYSSTTNPFTFSTDKTTTGNYKLEVPTPARAVLAGSSGSLLGTYGKGDYEFNRFNVILRNNRGADNGVTLRYGKNITDIKSVIDMTNVYTGIVPYWTDSEGNIVTLTEKVVLSDHVDDYPYKIIKPVDFSDKFENAPTQNELRTIAHNYVANNEGWTLKNNITVSFVALWNTEEYKSIAALERVKMCDIVHIVFPKLDINVDAKVIKTDYDVLQEKYNSITLGDSYYNLSSMISDLSDEVKTAEENQKSFIQKAIDHATELITGGLGGHVVLKQNANGEPEEILIMDTDDISTANKIWRWNLNGLGYSSTGYSGQYGTAITMDGEIVANFITTGTMTANRVRAGLLTDEHGYNYWNLTTGEFSLSANATVGGSTVSSIASNAASSAVSAYDRSLDQQEVFDKLTNNGQVQGIYMSNNQLYINATYIQSGSLSADMVRTGYLTDEAGNNYWDLDTGTFSLSASATFGGQTVATIAGEVADDAISDYDETLDQSEVFSRLTNNGAVHGIFMQNGELYINATYIATGTLSDPLGKTVLDLSTGSLITENFSVTATNFTLDTQGNLTATGATLNNADIVSESGNLEVQIYDGEINFSYNNQYVGSIGSSYGQHGQQGSYGNAIEISGDNITLDATNGGIDAYGYFLAHDDLDVNNTLHVGGDVTFDGYSDISILGNTFDATCNYDISFHTNNGNFTINGNVPIYDVGASLLITSSVDPDATTADYWYIDNTQVWFNLTLNISPCTT